MRTLTFNFGFADVMLATVTGNERPRCTADQEQDCSACLAHWFCIHGRGESIARPDLTQEPWARLGILVSQQR